MAAERIVRRIAAPAVAMALLAAACGGGSPPAASPGASPPPRPWILLVTLDTTRADAVGPEAAGVETPAFNALAKRGRRFAQAYATVPETLPSHASIMTGLYPAGHGVHQNARVLAASHPLLAERLKAAGYRTAAVVSSFVLARRFGLARGFDVYDDALPGGSAERAALATTDRALAALAAEGGPLFLWVHYFDAHAPYAPPEPFRARYKGRPYLGEVAAVDEQLGRLIAAFEGRAGRMAAIAVVADHGEGLGDHGELQHGNLLYQSTMHVPLVLVAPGVAPGVADTPVSTRRLYDTVLGWAGIAGAGSLLSPTPEVVLGEAMRPFLAYGWQPQAMAVEGRTKAIRAGALELYDVVADPSESRNLAPGLEPPRSVRTALLDYPTPSLETGRAAEALGEAERRQLASLGYVSGGAAPVVRADAPRPAAMAALFPLLEKASGLFVREEYAAVVPLLLRIRAADPGNLDATLRLATAYSMLGQRARAEAAFDEAASLAPHSNDVRAYRALHDARGRDWKRAGAPLERVLADEPERLPVIEALAVIREKEGRVPDAIALWRRILALRAPTPAELAHLGALAMAIGDTSLAIEALEKARSGGGPFRGDLELGVLYLAARRFPEARDALDRVPPTHPEYPMALFKRAQVSVLLHEEDREARIARARERADATTRPLIEKERLFR